MKRAFIALLSMMLGVSVASADGNPPDDHGGGKGRMSVSVAYLGEMLLHPGVAAGLDLVLMEKGLYSLSFSGRVGWYVHIRNHHAILIEPAIVNRVTGKSGFLFDLAVGAGYMGRILCGDVYVRDPSGGVMRKATVLRSKLLISGYIGIGYDLESKTGIPIAFYIRPGIMGEYPYNGYMLPHIVLDAGIRIRKAAPPKQR